MAVALGWDPVLPAAACMGVPAGVCEYDIMGGMRQEPVELVKCETVDLYVPATSEIVLEGEILPVGWTKDEGRFGEFTHLQGDIKWNPVVRINAITHRKDAIFYALNMPWENDWLSGPAVEAAAWRVLKEASNYL